MTNLFPGPDAPHRGAFSRQEFRAMGELGCEVRVIAPRPWTEVAAARLRGGDRRPSGLRARLDGLEVAYPTYWFPPKTGRGWYGACLARSIRGLFREWVEEFRPDLVIGSWAYPDGWAAVRLAREAGLPAVVKLHGSDIRALDKHPGRKRGTARTLREADAVVAVSRDLARRAVELGAPAERVRVVYYGVNRSIFHRGSRAEARRRLRERGQAPPGVPEEAEPGDGIPLVLFVGNLLPVKGIDVLLEALAMLRRPPFGRDFRAVLLGGGPLEREIGERARRPDLEGRVFPMGPKPHAELADWYRAADLLVLPSRSEGVPNVLLEAAACGLPFVASRVGGVPEIEDLGDRLLVPPEDARALAAALDAALRGELEPASRTVGDLAENLRAQAGILRRVARGLPLPPESDSESGSGNPNRIAHEHEFKSEPAAEDGNPPR